jgi:hypothetical protein
MLAVMTVANAKARRLTSEPNVLTGNRRADGKGGNRFKSKSISGAFVDAS